MMPDLSEPYATALNDAVAYLHERYTPIGIVVSGTIVRGNPGPSSDLDIVVVHEQPWRQRTQRFFNGVPAEMFVNPVFQIRRQMLKDAGTGRPVMAHMLATGAIVEDPTGIAATLQSEASDNLAAGHTVFPELLLTMRYGIVTAFEDAVDIRDVDQDRAHTLAAEAMIESAKLYFLMQGRWLPRSKDLLTDLEALDPALGTAMRGALRATDVHARLALADTVVHRIAGATGFFEWESEPQQMSPDPSPG